MRRLRPASALEAYLTGFDRARRDRLRRNLDSLASALSEGRHAADTFDWLSLTLDNLRDPSRFAGALRPADLRSAKRALNGLLRQFWLQGRLTTERYHELTSVSWMRTTTHIGPRRLATQEAIEEMKEQCRRDCFISGRRDLAMLSILATGACNGAELVRIQHGDYNPAAATLRISGMTPPLKADEDCKEAIDLWLQSRGETPGPLFCAATQPLLPPKPLTASAVTWILRKRAQQAGVPYVSSEDLRRSGILERRFHHG